MKGRFIILLMLTALMLTACTRDGASDTNQSTAGTEPEQEEIADPLDIGNCFLSLTASYNDPESVLHEVYAVYDFKTGNLEEMLSLPATSSYPCGVCDLSEGIVYYSAAEETEINGRTVFLDNVYAYDSVSGQTSKITDYGYYINRMIPVDGKLYFAGGKRSSAAVQFGWIDLDDNSVVYPECYADVQTINVRDIVYSCTDRAFYIAWYSLKEQTQLDREAREQSSERKLAAYHLDRFDPADETCTPLEVFDDFQLETFSVSQDGDRVFLYGLQDDAPMRMRENGQTTEFTYPGSAMTVMSPDGTAMYYISVSENMTNGVPDTVLNCYDFASGKSTELAKFPFYVNNMVLLPK